MSELFLDALMQIFALLTDIRVEQKTGEGRVITSYSIHYTKLYELIAKGLSEVLGVEMQKDNLHRSSFTSTQTKKGRYDRWENVKDVFALTDSSLIQNKHILLVDDVLTTGATIEACLQALTRITSYNVCYTKLLRAL